jgi:hypothetical protein
MFWVIIIEEKGACIDEDSKVLNYIRSSLSCVRANKLIARMNELEVY